MCLPILLQYPKMSIHTLLWWQQQWSLVQSALRTRRSNLPGAGTMRKTSSWFSTKMSWVCPALTWNLARAPFRWCCGLCVFSHSWPCFESVNEIRTRYVKQITGKCHPDEKKRSTQHVGNRLDASSRRRVMSRSHLRCWTWKRNCKNKTFLCGFEMFGTQEQEETRIQSTQCYTIRWRSMHHQIQSRNENVFTKIDKYSHTTWQKECLVRSSSQDSRVTDELLRRPCGSTKKRGCRVHWNRSHVSH